MPRSTPDWDALHSAIAGEVILPGSPAYESARKPAMARFHHIRPQAVVRCQHADDVAETLAFARRWGVRAAPRSGGHCFAGRSSTDGIVIDVTPMHDVSVSDGLATVGAGTRLEELYDALQQHDLTIPAGCGPTVGIAGLTLGGGFGILGRKHGLTCDHLVSAQVVLADGRIVDCDEHHDGELFWALRGAGGHFGVVTSLVFSTLPAPAATRFHLTWPYHHAAAVIAAWQAWAPAAPDELDANLRLAAVSDADRPPVVHLFGAMLAGQAEALNLLDQLVARAGAEPASASHTQLPYRDLKRSLVGLGSADENAEPDRPGHVFSKSEFFRRLLPSEAITALLRHLPQGQRAGQWCELNFTPLAGAYNRVPADATAYVHRQERFLLEHVATVAATAPTPVRDAARRWAARSWACSHPWGSGRVYPNFPDPDLTDWAEAYYGANYQRLLRIKRTYDPQNLFRFEQSL